MLCVGVTSTWFTRTTDTCVINRPCIRAAFATIPERADPLAASAAAPAAPPRNSRRLQLLPTSQPSLYRALTTAIPERSTISAALASRTIASKRCSVENPFRS